MLLGHIKPYRTLNVKSFDRTFPSDLLPRCFWWIRLKGMFSLHRAQRERRESAERAEAHRRRCVCETPLSSQGGVIRPAND